MYLVLMDTHLLKSSVSPKGLNRENLNQTSMAKDPLKLLIVPYLAEIQ
ncbi:hypothetical protein FOXYSP1_05757 [Fusarium oxysporum f. sp. phaseoli]